MLLSLLVLAVAAVAIVKVTRVLDRQGQRRSLPPSSERRVEITITTSDGPRVVEATPPPFNPTQRRRTIGIALQHHWDLELLYCDANGEWTKRRVTPEWLGGAQSGRENDRTSKVQFGAYCHLRREPRTFRIDRCWLVVPVCPNPEMREKYAVYG